MRSLRIKTLVAVTAAVLLVLGATVFLARPILLEGFSRVEDREFNGNIKRIHNRVGNDLEKVKTMATDYARWDDEYKALKERGSAWDTFVKGNLGDGTLSNAKMNALAFIEPSGNIFFGRENTGPDAKEVEIGGKLLDRLKSAEFLARYANLADPKFTTSGIEVWDGHIWLIGAASLTNAETTLPPNGTFIYARIFDEASMETISKELGYELHLIRNVDASDKTGFTLSETSANAKILIDDAKGAPAFLIKVDFPREIMEQGRTTLSAMIGLILAGGVILMVVILVTIESQVLRRLLRLKTKAEQIIRGTVEDKRLIDNGNDELRELTDTINTMVGTIEKQSNEIRTILAHINEGICMVDADTRIAGESSAWLKKVMPDGQSQGADLAAMLEKSSDLSAEATSQIKSFMTAVVGEDPMAFMGNDHLVPREFNLKDNQGNSLNIEAEWISITSKEDITERVLVVLRDVTAIKKLREESAKATLGVAILNEVVTCEPSKFDQFLDSTKDYIEQLRKRVTSDKLDNDNLVVVKRILHTIKGNARAAKLSTLSDAIHNVETDIHKNPVVQVVKSSIARTEEQVGLYLDWYQRLQKRAGLTTSQPKDVPVTIKIGEAFEQLVQEHRDTAKELGIDSLKLTLTGERHATVTRNTWVKLSDAFNHMIRNSLDHGMKGRAKEGELRIHLGREGDKLVLSYQDSGGGLNMTKIREKANNNSLLSVERQTLQTLAELIFSEGLSTADQVTTLSGRGSGMGAVKDIIEEMSGSIRVEVLEQRGADYHGFRIHIAVPS